MAVAGVGVVEIRPDLDGFTRSLNSSVDSSMRSMGSRFKSGFKTAGKVALVGGAALGGLAVAGFSKAFSEAAEAEKIGRLTEAVIKSTGAAAKVSAKQVGDLANALSQKAGIDDEVIQEGENMLLTFTKIRNETGKGNDVFNQATEAALNMSVALGQDMKGASMQVGKALNDPIKGVTALSRAGVSFTAQQKEQITALTETGDVLGAQKIILGELETQFGGAAEAAATPMDRLQVSFGNIMETIGVQLMPVVEKLAGFLSDMLPKAFAWAKEAVGGLVDGFKGVGDDDIFSRIGAAAQLVWTFIVDTAVPAIQSVISDLVDGWKGKGEGFFAEVGSAAEKVVTFFREKVIPFLRDKVIPWVRDTLWPAIQAAFKNIAAAIDKTWDVAKPIFEAIVRFIADKLIPFVRDKLWPVVRDVFDAVGDAIRTAWQVAKPIFQAVVSFVQDVLLPAFRAIKSTVMTIFNWVADKAKWLWDAFKNGPLGELVGWIADTLVPKLAAIADAIGGVFQGIPDAIGAALRLAGNLVSGFLNGAAWVADKIGLDSIAESLRGAASTANAWGESTGGPSAIGGPSGNNTQMPLNRGGRVPGPNVNRDVVPAMLTPGEFVLRRQAVAALGVPYLESLNRVGYADGGHVIGPDGTPIPTHGVGVGQALGALFSTNPLEWAKQALEQAWRVLPGSALMGGIIPGAVNFLRGGVFDKILSSVRSLVPDFGGAAGVAPSPGQLSAIQALAQGMAAQFYGWTGPQWGALYQLVQHESGWNPYAQNPTSSAYGLFQFLDSTWAGVGATKTSNPAGQISAGLRYISQRYGNPAAAWSFWNAQSPHWYAKGGLVSPVRMHDRSFDVGGVLQPGWNMVRNDTGRPEEVTPGRGGVNIGTVVLNDREDVDEFWRRSEFAARAGSL